MVINEMTWLEDFYYVSCLWISKHISFIPLWIIYKCSIIVGDWIINFLCLPWNMLLEARKAIRIWAMESDILDSNINPIINLKKITSQTKLNSIFLNCEVWALPSQLSCGCSSWSAWVTSFAMWHDKGYTNATAVTVIMLQHLPHSTYLVNE